ncbi:hypothetical protein BDV93DRAFT_528495 [Ceratobasidium sp. AG-I]|nr:hypothetical protein BDV93DRAFT_528495 [Ceratobasidium sp. AG-I]
MCRGFESDLWLWLALLSTPALHDVSQAKTGADHPPDHVPHCLCRTPDLPPLRHSGHTTSRNSPPDFELCCARP